jgi:predicted MFS family arabinose efflux permease
MDNPTSRPKAFAATPAGLASVSAFFFANGVTVGCWTVLVPVILSNIGITETAMGMMILGGSAAGFCVLVFTGRLVAALGSRTVTVVASLALAPALLLLAAAPTFAIAALLFVYFFVAMSVMDVAMNANGAAMESYRGSAVMSRFHGFWSLGGMVGAGLGGPVLVAAGPIGTGALPAVVAVGTVLLATRYLVPAAAEFPEPAKRSWRPPGNPAVYLVGLLAFSAFVAEGAVIDWSALYLRRDLQADIAYSGFAFALFSMSMMIGRFAGDAIRNRFGARRTVRISAATAAAGFAIAGLSGSLPAVVGGFAVAGLGCANIVPVAFSSAAAIQGVRPATGIAIVTMFGYGGMLAGPAPFGAVGDTYGFAPVYIGFAFAMGAAILLSGILPQEAGKAA